MMNLGRHGVFATLRKTRGRGTEEALQPGKSFASEAESIDSHIAKNGLESGNLSEQSSIHSDDVSVDVSVNCCTRTRSTSNSAAAPLTLIQEVSFGLDVEDKSAEKILTSTQVSSSGFKKCKPPSQKNYPFRLFAGMPPRKTEEQDVSIRAIHKRSVAIDSPKPWTHRTLFPRRSISPPKMKNKSPSESPLNDVYTRNLYPIQALSPAHARHRRKNRLQEIPNEDNENLFR